MCVHAYLLGKHISASANKILKVFSLEYTKIPKVPYATSRALASVEEARE
jgi:hypothetical protein